jgi:hypothetical protein
MWKIGPLPVSTRNHTISRLVRPPVAFPRRAISNSTSADHPACRVLFGSAQNGRLHLGDAKMNHLVREQQARNERPFRCFSHSCESQILGSELFNNPGKVNLVRRIDSFFDSGPGDVLTITVLAQ